MQSRQVGELRRSIMSALAAVLTTAAPSLVSTRAFADTPPEKAPDAAAANATAKGQGAKSETKHTKRTHAAKKAPVAKQETKPAPVATSANAKGKKAKRTASRAAGKGRKTAKKSDKEAPKRRCVGEPITIDRTGLEAQSYPIVDCHREPLDAARVALSVLARPWGAQKPEHLPRLPADTSGAHAGDDLAPGVRLLDKGLLSRIDAIAHRFPGRPISLVSGYRPQSRGSLHQSARALDLRVAGASNEELVAFCKTLRDTGCGYYPNSSFVHVDVRNPGTGSVSWIDASGPGEGPHYVRRWPPPPEESDQAVLPVGSTAVHDPGADPWAELEDRHPATAAGDPPLDR